MGRACEPRCQCNRHRPFLDERRARISAAKAGRPSNAPPCAEGCACGKHSVRNSGQFQVGGVGFTGTHSDEARRRIREARARQVNVSGPRPTDPLPRFIAKVMPITETGCHIWTGALSTKGYGRFGVEHGRVVQAHRFAYELVHGPVPEGLEIDHLCRVRSCVNEEHLEAVTHAENIRRAVAA